MMRARYGNVSQPKQGRRGSAVVGPAPPEDSPGRGLPTFKVMVGRAGNSDTTASTSQRKWSRARTSAVLFVVGIVLLLWAWGSWLYRTSAAGGGLSAGRGDASGPPPETAEVVRMLPLLLLAGLLLVLAFLAGSFVLVRASRRYRMRRWQSGRGAGGRGSAPTATDDVWAMHKLPDDVDLGDADREYREP